MPIGIEHIIDYTLVYTSPQMDRVYNEVLSIAPTNSTTNLTGETGTGKELLARLIHDCSKRCNGPFIAVNCAEKSSPLFHNEFFGHEKGAFTDAKERRIGYMEEADGGTLFLDEITEIGRDEQKDLIRALEYGFTRIGGRVVVTPDIRLVTASNKSLNDALNEDVLDKGFYFRIRGSPIDVPPLREREGEIIYLANYFCRKFSMGLITISPDGLKYLERYNWPGNVRELKSVIQIAVEKRLAQVNLELNYVVPQEGIIENDVSNDNHKPALKLEKNNFERLINDNPQNRNNDNLYNRLISKVFSDGIDWGHGMTTIRIGLIRAALRTAQGNDKLVADVLNINYDTLRKFIRKYDITI